MPPAASTPLFQNVFDGDPARVEITDTGSLCVIARCCVWTFSDDLKPLQFHVFDNDMGNFNQFIHRDGKILASTKMDGMWFEQENVTPENNQTLASFAPALQALHAIAKQTPQLAYTLEHMPAAYTFFGLAEPME